MDGEAALHPGISTGALLDLLPAAIYTTDADGNVTFYNQAAADLWGCRPELGSARWCGSWRLFWPDGTPMAHAECPMAVALKENRPVRGVEAIAERPDGTRVPFMPLPTPLRDARGALIGGVNVLVDISDRKRAEAKVQKLASSLEERIAERTRELAEMVERLTESERKFRLVVESVTDYAICTLDPEGIITNWNTGAERIKGYTAQEIIGQHFSRFYTEEDRLAGLPQKVLETARNTGKCEIEGWRVRKDGSRFWASVVVDAIHDEVGALVGFAKITRDLTERRKLEEQLHQAQKMEAIGQLTGGAAHDFNNLLTTIIGNVELAQIRADDPALRRLLANVQRAGERGAKLTEHLLAFSRKQHLVPEPIDTEGMIFALAEMLPRTIGPTVAISTRVAEGIWPVLADESQLELALLNLAINARDAMPAGGALVLATANLPSGSANLPAELAAGDYVVISVADTGIGMPEEIRVHAFEPFFTTKGAGRGSGLGLSMVYGFARQSGGTVTLDSRVDAGTTVRLYLPRAQLVPVAVDARPKRDALEPGRRARILLVDDDLEVRHVAGLLLRELGHEVVEAENGPAALATLEADRQFDLLMADLAMPYMHGAELAERARKLVPGLPALFTTGYSDMRWVAEGDVLKKPFRRAELAAKLRMALERAAPEPKVLPMRQGQRTAS